MMFLSRKKMRGLSLGKVETSVKSRIVTRSAQQQQQQELWHRMNAFSFIQLTLPFSLPINKLKSIHQSN